MIDRVKMQKSKALVSKWLVQVVLQVLLLHESYAWTLSSALFVILNKTKRF